MTNSRRAQVDVGPVEADGDLGVGGDDGERLARCEKVDGSVVKRLWAGSAVLDPVLAAGPADKEEDRGAIVCLEDIGLAVAGGQSDKLYLKLLARRGGRAVECAK